MVHWTMCALAERVSQSEIVLPLRTTCYYSPLAEVGVFSIEIKMEEGAIRRLVWNAIADMHWKKAKGHGIVYIGREMPRFCRR